MLHVRHVPERNGGNLGLRKGSMELCLRGELLGVHPKSHNVSVMNEKTYDYISMDYIQLV